MKGEIKQVDWQTSGHLCCDRQVVATEVEIKVVLEDGAFVVTVCTACGMALVQFDREIPSVRPTQV